MPPLHGLGCGVSRYTLPILMALRHHICHATRERLPPPLVDESYALLYVLLMLMPHAFAAAGARLLVFGCWAEGR